MNRKLCKLQAKTTMFGTQIDLVQDGTVLGTLVSDSPTNWCKKNKKVTQESFWLRAPNLDLNQLSVTAQMLADVDHAFEFRVWHQNGKYDASLKLVDQADVALLAWSLNGVWGKWSTEDEQQLVASAKPQKPVKVKVLKDGTIKVKGKVTMSGYSPPSSD